MSDRNTGQLVARIFARAWRTAVPELDLSRSEFETAVPVALANGGAAILWKRIRSTPAAAWPGAADLHNAHRLFALLDSARRQDICQAITILRARGIEPLLGKGLASAVLYDDPGLRPYGDIDLWVEPKAYAAARAAIDGQGLPADLHQGFASLDDCASSSAIARAARLDIDGMQILTFGPEDHLRLIALHLLGHGAWRPLWLCDLGAAVERADDRFDWEYCLRGPETVRGWIVTAITLGGEVLEADLTRVPEPVRREPLQTELVDELLGQWGRPHFMQEPPLSESVRRPAALVRALRRRWPNAFETAVHRRTDFGTATQLRTKVGEMAQRTRQFLRGRSSVVIDGDKHA